MQSIKLCGANISNTKGDILVLDKPFSFWGGMDISTATIVDTEQTAIGQQAAGKIVIVNGIKGSTAGPGALLEWIVSEQHAPIAVISTQFEPVLYSAFAMAQLVAKKNALAYLPFYAFIDEPFDRLPNSFITIENNILFFNTHT
jgi:hypothetical protein